MVSSVLSKARKLEYCSGYSTPQTIYIYIYLDFVWRWRQRMLFWCYFPGRLWHFICRPRGVCISVIIILAFGASQSDVIVTYDVLFSSDVIFDLHWLLRPSFSARCDVLFVRCDVFFVSMAELSSCDVSRCVHRWHVNSSQLGWRPSDFRLYQSWSRKSWKQKAVHARFMGHPRLPLRALEEWQRFILGYRGVAV